MSEGTHKGLKSLLTEPLVHFLLVAALFLGVYQFASRAETESAEVILVTGERIEQIQQLLAKGLLRPPTEQEVKLAIDDYVKEEIYYREAIELGLDRDDTVIRRRLRQKMEFLADVETIEEKPTDEQLRAYWAAHKEKFKEDPRLAFQHVFISSAGGAELASGRAQGLRDRLNADPTLDFGSLGDRTALPSEMPPTPVSSISAVFGAKFAASLEKLENTSWMGPITTSFGLHIVRVTDRTSGTGAEFSSVRDRVAREWAYAKRQELEDARFAAYLKKYRVQIQMSDTGGTP